MTDTFSPSLHLFLIKDTRLVFNARSPLWKIFDIGFMEEYRKRIEEQLGYIGSSGHAADGGLEIDQLEWEFKFYGYNDKTTNNFKVRPIIPNTWEEGTKLTDLTSHGNNQYDILHNLDNIEDVDDEDVEDLFSWSPNIKNCYCWDSDLCLTARPIEDEYTNVAD